MRRVKVLVLTTAGVLLLALGYCFGSRPSSAQGASTISAAFVGYNDANVSFAVVGRTLYAANGAGAGFSGAPYPGGPIPGTEAAISVGWGVGGAPIVMLANGDVWWGGAGNPGYTWAFLGNAIGSPTLAPNATWGQLKARYK